MPRKSREYSISNIYHVILKGNDRQDIFYDEEDRYLFLEKIKILRKKFKFDVFSYCLMSNHIHIVIKVEDIFLSKLMQSLGIRYSMYFNKKYNRTGHLFEERFFSKKIENLRYLLEVTKYIHRNPEKACIQKTEDYKWSSYNEYIYGNRDIIDTRVLLHYYDNKIENFKKHTLENNDKEIIGKYAEFELKKMLSEIELNEIIKKKFELINASDISNLEVDKRNAYIKELKEIEGTSLSQLSRVTKVSKYYIKKCWNDK